MFKRLDRILGGCLCVLLLSCGLAGAYDYPFADPYVATVVGTPTEYMEVLPAEVPVKFDTLQMFPERDVPGILWNLDELRYSYIRQKDPAPLIFLIAGTGAGFNSPKMQLMQKAFYRAGYHVISISSPTHPNFIVAASTSGVPGHLEEDSADLYKVMQAIWQKHQKKMEVTEFYLTGYSLGAAQSAFIARLDEQEQAFNFRKVLLINPPVSLYNSVLILDEMLEHNIPGGLDNFKAFYQRIVNAFADVYAHGEDVQFNNDFLYRAYEYRKPSSDEPLAALIGTSFRISSENMAFTTDVLTKAGYVVPKNLVLRRHDNVRDYAKVLSRLSFLDYFRGIFVPHFQAQDPSVTEAQLIKTLSLRSLDEYLRNSAKFGLIGNEDDLILLPGEIDYLRDLFGSRATIFPHGGHCGNMAYPDNVSAMVSFFADAKN
ncbi:MAG: alpha/beta fold hydrolase [Deltaproteobacteria bacterium]|nr:alpha/beta fold hydrolase [Deltaproteobacteria bacterium]